MSLKQMTAVWEHSKAKGSQLLLLLAIADNASDDGLAWPGLENLAQRSRLSKRGVIKALGKAEESGELKIHRRSGKHNHYLLDINKSDEQRTGALTELAKRVDESIDGLRDELFAPVNPSSPGSEPQFTSTSEPQFTRSINRTTNEPSNLADTPNSGLQSADEPSADPTPAPQAKPKSGRIPRALMNAICEKLIEVLEYDRDTLTDTDWSSLRGVASEIGAAGAKPEDIEPLHRFVRDVKGPALGFTDFTEQALKKYWKDYVKNGRPKPNAEPDYSQGDPLFDPAYRGLSIMEVHELDQKRLLEQLEKLDKPA